MQIFQWLLKAAHDHKKEASNGSKAALTEARSKDVVLFNKTGVSIDSEEHQEQSAEEEGKWNNSSDIFLKKGVHNSSTFFLQQTDLKQLLIPIGADLIITMGRNCMADFCDVGGKVLPLCDASAPSSAQTDNGKDNSKKSNSGNECPQKNNSHKEGKKRRAMSKMKELIRWAAASNPDKGGSKRWKVLYFRNRGVLRCRCDDELVSDSSKLSFKFDVGSRYAAYASSACSPISVSSERMITRHSSLPPAKVSISACTASECMTMKRENWITTDSDFVVLEL